MARRERVIELLCDPDWPNGDGYRVTVTRQGIEVFAYHGIVGIRPMSVTWAELLAAKAEVDAVKHSNSKGKSG